MKKFCKKKKKFKKKLTNKVDPKTGGKIGIGLAAILGVFATIFCIKRKNSTTL